MCVYVYVYVHVYVHVDVWMCACVILWMDVCLCMYVCMHVCICMYWRSEVGRIKVYVGDAERSVRVENDNFVLGQQGQSCSGDH